LNRKILTSGSGTITLMPQAVMDRNTPRHPRYSLDSSIQVAEALFAAGGLGATTDALAHYLHYKSAANGAFLARLVASRLFGLVEGTPKSLKPTPRAHAILRPDYDWVATRAKFEAFVDVPLYRAFLDEYEGRPLPPTAGMVNALQTKFGIGVKDAPPVLDRLLDSADTAGLFQVTGDRTKMIRPQIGGSTMPESSESRSSDVVVTAPMSGSPGGTDWLPTHGKLLDGLWELLPPSDKWDERELQTWLGMFTMALRVRYRLPEHKKLEGS
jgi:hypothetical protein